MKRDREEEEEKESEAKKRREREIEAITPEESVYPDGGGWRRGAILGAGAHGMVHKAHFPRLPLSARFEAFPSTVAAKSAYTSSSKELEAEKRVYAAVGDSPFILRCFGDDVTGGGLVLNVFLEYAHGGTLFDLIQTSGGTGLLEPQARVFTRAILAGIERVHEAGFVHCDLKPNNVFLFEDGEGFRAKIGDFSSAKSVEDDDGAGIIQGTEIYLAPESLELEIQEQASDIWALGCVVFAMLTGTLDWEFEPMIEEMAKSSGGKVSGEAEDFVRTCLTRDPSERPTATMLLSHPFVSGVEAREERFRQPEDDEVSLASASETLECDEEGEARDCDALGQFRRAEEDDEKSFAMELEARLWEGQEEKESDSEE